MKGASSEPFFVLDNSASAIAQRGYSLPEGHGLVANGQNGDTVEISMQILFSNIQVGNFPPLGVAHPGLYSRTPSNTNNND